MVIRFLAGLEKRSRFFWTMTGILLVGGVGVLDFLTGYELAFSLFYLIPVSLVAWHAGQRLGILTSLASAIVWLTADVAAGNFYSHPFIYAWNTLIRLGFFIVTVLLLSTLRSALQRERESARTDYLTGAANSRLFYDLVQMEMDRSKRYERRFTLAYIDLDNFKAVNDRFGHPVGDQVLRTVVSSAQKNLRKTDVVARLGGDEFALLLPESDQGSARVVLAKLQGGLAEEMRQHHWPVTFSIGVLTCSAVPDTIVELVKMADELMYAAKRGGKDAIQYATYAGRRNEEK
jgi:diguanylate cyclase (GGDEF)-like protein